MPHEEDTRATILAAARLLVQQYGFHKITMDDIARAMGRRRSSLYYYFPGKNELISALVANELAEISRAVRGEVARQADPVDRLKTYLISSIEQVALRFAVYSKILGEIQDVKEPRLNILDISKVYDISKQAREFHATETCFLAGLIIDGIKAGKFAFMSDGSVAVFAHFLFAGLRGVHLDLIMEPGRTDDVRSRLDLSFDIMLKGLLIRETSP